MRIRHRGDRFQQRSAVSDAGTYLPQALNTGVQNVDLLDPSRGQGFAQFEMTAPAMAAAAVTQTGQLTGSGTGNPTSTATIAVRAASTGRSTASLPNTGAASDKETSLALSLTLAGALIQVLAIRRRRSHLARPRCSD